MTVSFVLMSPSIVMRLNDCSTACCTAFCNAALPIAASVVTKHNMVAMLGQIIPAPLAQAPMRTVLPPIWNCTAVSFGRVSLVMMARAKSVPLPVPNWPQTSAMRGSIRSIGIGKPMMPVEQTATCALPQAQGFRRRLRHRLRVLDAPRPGARVGIPAVRDDGLHLGAPHVLLRNPHRSRFHPVGRERPRRHARHQRPQDHQDPAWGFSDP